MSSCHFKPTLLRLLILTLLVLILASCSEAAAPVTVTVEATVPPAAAPTDAPVPMAEAPAANLTDGCFSGDPAGLDLFPDRVSLEYAEAFSVEYGDNYKLVTIHTPWPGAEQELQYLLVQCGTAPPEGMEDIPLIEVPVSRALVLSTTYITQMDDLGVLDRLVGLDAFAYTSNPAVLAMIEEGKLVEIAPTGIEANVEVALDAEPDLIMAFSAGIPEYDLYPPLQDAGLPVVISADWIESAPLARAEWVKFMSLFFNAEAEANRVFETIATEYEAAAALVAGVSDKPLVMSDVPYEGTWYLSGGQSYTARLFRDAGGQYVWAGDPSEGTLALDIETVFDQAIDAEVWVNVFGYEGLADLAALDERVTGFAAFQNGQVYANDARGTAFGTELFETGVAHPHVVLLDLIRIFHPDLLPDHALYYYRQLQ